MPDGMKPQHRNSLNPKRVEAFVAAVVGDDMHAKRLLSLANASLGAIHSASLAVSTVGQALAQAKGLKPKHALKQVDRLLSNQGVDLWRWFEHWVPHVVAARREIVVALDWTEFDKDDRSTLAISLVTRHGRATPLMWMSVVKSELAGRRNAHEDRLLARLKECVPDGVEVTVLADRGFGDADFYALHWELGLDHIIRLRGNITPDFESV